MDMGAAACYQFSINRGAADGAQLRVKSCSGGRNGDLDSGETNPCLACCHDARQ